MTNLRSKRMPKDAFWTTRGITWAAVRLRRHYENARNFDLRKRRTRLIPERSNVRRALGAGISLRNILTPITGDWSAAELAYVQHYLNRRPIRILAARLGRSPRSVRRIIVTHELDREADIISWECMARILDTSMGKVKQAYSLIASKRPPPYGIAWDDAEKVLRICRISFI